MFPRDYLERSRTFTELASLLRASRALSSPRMLAYAQRALSKFVSEDDAVEAALFSNLDAVEAIVLGREHDAPSLIKRAFYKLLHLEDAVLFALQTRKHGPHMSTTDEDIALLSSARRRVDQHWVKSCLAPIPFLMAPCPSALNAATPGCETSIRHAGSLTDWTKVLKHDILASGALSEYDLYAGEAWNQYGYCELCGAAAQTFWREKKQEVWEELHVWLGLPSAADANSEKREVSNVLRRVASGVPSPASPAVSKTCPGCEEPAVECVCGYISVSSDGTSQHD